MKDSKALMLSILITVPVVGLPIGMAIDHGTDWLVDHSYEQMGYSKAQIRSMDKLLGDASTRKDEGDTKKKIAYTSPVKHVTYRRQAAALKDLWQISEADIAAPVRLWRAR